MAGELLRRALDWPESARGQILLGALAPDAHTEAPDLDRTCVHPEPGEDLVTYVTNKLTPPDALDDLAGRAFAVSCVAHLVADEMTRLRPYRLPEAAPTGLVQLAEATAASASHTVDIPAIRHALGAAPAKYALRPLTPAMIDAKREKTLERSPLCDGVGLFVVVDPLGEVIEQVIAQALGLLREAEASTLLLDGGERSRR